MGPISISGSDQLDWWEEKAASIKAGLHHNDYRSKLVRFKAQKYFLYLKKLA